jgi:hypothetical protein
MLDWLNQQPGVFAFKVNTTGVYDPIQGTFRTIKNRHVHRGTSDIVGIAFGRFFCIEVKTDTGLKRLLQRPSPHEIRQVEFIQRVIKYNGFAIVACTLEQVMTFVHDMRTLASIQ